MGCGTISKLDEIERKIIEHEQEQANLQKSVMKEIAQNVKKNAENESEQEVKEECVGPEFAEALKLLTDSIDNENFDDFMVGIQRIKQLVHAGGRLKSPFNIVDRMLQICASKYVQGLESEWARTAVVSATSLLFQWAMAEYLPKAKVVGRVSADIKQGWSNLIPTIRDGGVDAITCHVHMLEEGMKLLKLKKKDIGEQAFDKIIEVASFVGSCIQSQGFDVGELIQQGVNLCKFLYEKADTAAFKAIFLQISFINRMNTPERANIFLEKMCSAAKTDELKSINLKQTMNETQKAYASDLQDSQIYVRLNQMEDIIQKEEEKMKQDTILKTTANKQDNEQVSTLEKLNNEQAEKSQILIGVLNNKWQVAFAVLDVVLTIVRQKDAFCNKDVVNVLWHYSSHSKAAVRQKVVEICICGWNLYCHIINEKEDCRKSEEQCKCNMIFNNLLQKKLCNKETEDKQQKLQLYNKEVQDVYDKFNVFQKIILWNLNNSKNERILQIINNPSAVIEAELIETRTWEEWKKQKQIDAQRINVQIEKVLELIKSPKSNHDQLQEQLIKLQDEQVTQYQTISVFLAGIEYMKDFVSGFSKQIDDMKTKIDKVSMQIDRLAEVNLGRDCQKLVRSIEKYNTKLADDYDWKERLRCYIPEKCIVKDAQSVTNKTDEKNTNQTNQDDNDVEKIVKNITKENSIIRLAQCKELEELERNLQKGLQNSCGDVKQTATKNATQVILVSGNAGTGKSMCMQHITTDVMENNNSLISASEGVILVPIYVNLNAIGQERASHDLVQAVFSDILGFSQVEIGNFKKQAKYQILLILDGYDEIFNDLQQNLYKNNELNSWICLNLVIFTCRTQLLQNNASHFQSFANRNEEFKELELQLFDEKQIDSYLNTYLEVKQIRGLAQSYHDNMHNIPELLDLINNPLIYSMIIEILPQLLDKLKGGKIKRVMKIHIYELFVKKWYDKEMQRHNMQLTFESCFNYAKALASQMMRCNTIVLDSKQCFESMWKEYFDPDSMPKQYFYNELLKDQRISFERLKNYLPLQESNQKYRFFHKSVQEYFAACSIVNEVKQILLLRNENITNENKMAKVLQKLGKNPQGIQNLPINQYLIRDQGEISFINELIHSDIEFKSQLFEVVYMSRTNDEVQMASSNAISLLNFADINFSKMDFSNIKIPNACLQISQCEWTNFSGSKLEGVDFCKANLRFASFSKCLMKDVRFGQRADLLGHSSYVVSVAFSKDNKYIVSGSNDHFIKLWNVESGAEVRTFKGHSDCVNSVALSSDNKYIVSGSDDHFIKLWDVESGTEIKTFKGHSNDVNSVVFSNDNKYIVSGSSDSTIKLWDVESGTEIKTFKVHSKAVNTIVFSNNNKYVVSGSSDSTIKLCDVESGTEVRTFKGHSSGVCSIAFSSDNKYIVSGSDDSTIKLWNAESGTEEKTFNGHEANVVSVAFSSDNKYIVSGSIDRTIKLWNAESGIEVKTFSGHLSFVCCAAFSSDNKYIVSGSSDAIMKLWNVESGIEIKTVSDHFSFASNVAFSNDNKYIISHNDNNTIKLWNVQSGTEEKIFKGYSSGVCSIAFSIDNKYIVSGSSDSTVKLWNAESGAEVKSFNGHLKSVIAVAFSKDNKYIISGSEDSTIKLWNIESGTEEKTLNGHSKSVFHVAFSNDNKYIVSGSDDHFIKLWNAESGVEVKSFKVHSKSVFRAAFSKDDKYIILGSSDAIMKLWNVESGTEIKTFKVHSKAVNTVVFSNDNKYIILGCSDSTIMLWNIESGTEEKTFNGHVSGVISVAFSNDNKYIVSGSWDQTIKLWNVESGAEVKTFKGHSDFVHSIAFSNGNKYFASASGDSTIKLWDVQTSKQENSIKFEETPKAVKFIDCKTVEVECEQNTFTYDLEQKKVVNTKRSDINSKSENKVMYSQDRKMCSQLVGNNVLIYETPIPIYSFGHSMKLVLSDVIYEDVKELDPWNKALLDQQCCHTAYVDLLKQMEEMGEEGEEDEEGEEKLIEEQKQNE